MTAADLAIPRRRLELAAGAHAATLAAVALATWAAFLVQRASGAPNASLVFVLPVVFAAVTFGWGPALAAAVAGVVAYNFFLIEPRYTFRVADPANVWALVLLLATAAAVSAVAAQSRRRALEAQAAAGQANALQSLARTLVGAASPAEIAACCAEAVSHVFRRPAAVLLAAGDGLGERALAGGARLSPADEDAARWALATGRASRAGAYPQDGSAYDFWPVTSRARERAVIGVRLADGDAGRPEAAERLVDIVQGYLAVALDREAYARRALDRRVRAEAERLQADLLAAVSHDLKTPLSTILVTLQSLRGFDASHDPETRQALLAGAEAEATRLARMVENLLDVSRVEADAVAVRPVPTARAEILARARERVAAALSGHRVEDSVPPDAPAVLADPVLLETALANVLENAARYAPPGGVVRIAAGEGGGLGWIEVLDEGPGFDAPPESYFGRFVRGRADDGRPPGTGLGLSIALAFMEAQDGALEAANRTDGPGARVRLSAPLAEPAP